MSKQNLSLEVRLTAIDQLTRPMKMVGLTAQQIDRQLAIARNTVGKLNKSLADGSGAEVHKQKLEQIAARLDRMRKASEQLQRAMTLRDGLASAGVKMTAAGAAMGAAMSVPVRAFAEAEDAGTQLAVSMMKAGGKVSPLFQEMNDLALRLGNRLPGTTADFQNMLTVLVRQGISEKAILGGLGESAALLAVNIKMPFEQAAEFAAKLQDATRTTEGDMLSLMDTIQRAFFAGTDANNMLNAFAKLSPALDTVRMKGLDAAKAMAPLLVMADQSGMDGSAAGNALRKVLQKSMNTSAIAKATSDLKKSMGLSLNFTDGKGEFAGLDRMFSEMAKLKQLNTETRLSLLKDIYGDDAEVMQVVSLLIDKGKAGYDETLAKLNAQANLQDRVNKQLGTLKNLWDAATGTFTNALVVFGEAISPELKAITEWIGRVSEGLGTWARENPELSSGLMKLLGAIAGVLTVAGGLALAVSAVLGPFAMAKLAIGVFGGGLLKFALMASPILLVIAAIAMAVYKIYENWGPITDWFRQQWDGLLSFFSGLGARFEQIGLDLMLGLSRGITNSWAAVKETVTGTADRVSGWFAEKLGINSPSRVFAELGGFTMEGLTQGLMGEQGGPLKAISDFAKRFAAVAAIGITGANVATAAPVPSLADARPLMRSSAASLPPVTPMTYVINIDARGAADAEGIRRVVREELETHRRQLDARKRSTLGDID